MDNKQLELTPEYITLRNILTNTINALNSTITTNQALIATLEVLEPKFQKIYQKQYEALTSQRNSEPTDLTPTQVVSADEVLRVLLQLIQNQKA